jgi:hypothetical protein
MRRDASLFDADLALLTDDPLRCSDLSKPDCLLQFETAARTLELMTLASISNMTGKLYHNIRRGTHYYLSLSYLYYLIFSSNS